MRVIVTGGAGFIGSNLVDRLIDDGHEVSVIDNLSTGKDKNMNPKAKFYRKDITQMRRDSDFTMFEGVDVVFHTAAMARVQPSIEDPISFNRVNVDGTLNLLKACVDYGVKRFVFSSSSSVYGNVDTFPTSENSPLNPISPYALQKLIGEQYCKLFSDIYGLETVCLRYFNVYGKRQLLEGAYTLVMGKFAQQLLNNEPMTIRGDGEQRRDFTYVGDVVEANVLASTNTEMYTDDVRCRAFNIGNGDNRSVNQIADMLGGERVNVDPVIEPKETLADNSKAREMLGWKTTMKIEEWVKTYKEELGI